jgi:hypothetical protein
MKIKLPDYDRIYKVINSVLLNEGANIEGACTFFSFYGAHILQKHYKMNAIPMAGLCFYHLGGDQNVLSFGRKDEQGFYSNTDGFHCWIVCDGWLIDFMAPEFDRLTKNHGFSAASKMMQKPLKNMVNSPFEIEKEGDFYFEQNTELLEERARYMSSKIGYSDLANICSQWFKKPPKKMSRSIPISDDKGKVCHVELTGKNLVGAW